MDLLKEFGWELTAAIYLGAGVSLTLMLLAIPKSWLAKASQRAWYMTANAQTIWRMPVVWLGWILMFAFGQHFAGFILAVFGLAMDRVDGKTAKGMMELENPKIPHNENLGKVIDPLADKLTFLPPFFVLAIQGIVPWWLVTPLVSLELLSTLMRRPFHLLISYQKTEKERKDQATGIGKLKVMFQFVTLLACGPLIFGWTTYSLWIPGILTGMTLVFGALSVLSRMSLRGRSKEVNDQLTDAFSHE